ncbi:MAG: NusG domain II-containing protein [Christensenellaceae bacterium]
MSANVLAKKPFKKGDIVVYCLILLTVALLMIPALHKQEYSGFDVFVDNKLVFSYNYNDGTYTAYGDRVSRVSDCVFNIDAIGGYNRITVDRASKKVYVSDTDCGVSKECVKMGKSSVIVCVPHKLVIKETNNHDTIKVG